jgi:G:T/U-mismatch repair DNA glycosylase
MTFPTEQQVEAVERVIHREETGSDARCGHCEIIARAALTALAPEWREVERDALRYRWLRNQIQSGPLVIAKASTWELNSWSGDTPDQVIDAAREREG